jgi:hypothetical protein
MHVAAQRPDAVTADRRVQHEAWRAAHELRELWEWASDETDSPWDAFWDGARANLPDDPDALDHAATLADHARQHLVTPTWPLALTGRSERESVRETMNAISKILGGLPDHALDPASRPDRPELGYAPTAADACHGISAAHRWLVARTAWADVFHALAPHLRPGRDET